MLHSLFLYFQTIQHLILIKNKKQMQNKFVLKSNLLKWRHSKVTLYAKILHRDFLAQSKIILNIILVCLIRFSRTTTETLLKICKFWFLNSLISKMFLVKKFFNKKWTVALFNVHFNSLGFLSTQITLCFFWIDIINIWWRQVIISIKNFK